MEPGINKIVFSDDKKSNTIYSVSKCRIIF